MAFTERLLTNNFFKRIDKKNEFVQNFYKAYNNSDENEILTLIYNFEDISSLIDLSQIDLNIKSYCYHPKLIPYWDNILMADQSLMEKLGLDFWVENLKPIPRIHSFNVIIGLYYFDQGYNVTSKKSIYPDLLEKAEQLGCFYAFKYFNKQDINFLSKKNNIDEIFIENMIARAYRAAMLHGTPGYLMLADTYLHIADYYKDCHPQHGIIKTAYQHGLKYFFTARRVKEYSENSIYNAFLGEEKVSDYFLTHEHDLALEKWLAHVKPHLDSQAILQARKEAWEERNNFFSCVFDNIELPPSFAKNNKSSLKL